MRIAIFGIKFFQYTKNLQITLEKLGHITYLFEYDMRCDNDTINREKDRIKKFNPDLFITHFYNPLDELIDEKFLTSMKCKKIYFGTDSIKRFLDIKQYFHCYDKIYLFEKDDINILLGKYNIDSKKIFIRKVGFNNQIYVENVPNNLRIEYDLSFVGGFTKGRLRFFEKIAKWVFKHNKRMIIYGNFYTEANWLKTLIHKIKFSLKYPYLSKYAVNSFLEPEKCAVLYKKSKICLNRHIEIHKSMNSRVFEIMANDNFLLSDFREQFEEYGLIDGKNMAVYRDVDECIEKIDFYLKEDNMRKTIAENGGRFVRENYTMKNVMKNVLEEIDM